MSTGARTTVSTLSCDPWKSGTSTSTRVEGSADVIAVAVAAKCAAPPSGRSSRSTDVTTTCCKPSRATASAIRRGSSLSKGRTLPCATAQYGQLRVHTSPISMKVAVRCEKHSPMLGQHASWQTECSFSSARIAFVRKYSGDTGARTLIQSGCFRSAITSHQLRGRHYLGRAGENDFVVTERARETLAHHGGELAHRHCALCLSAYGGHAASVDSARHDRIEVAKIGRHVQREAVPRDPAAKADADRRNLARADPDAGHRIAATRVDAEFCERIDHRGFETAEILRHVAVAAFELQNRIADQLAGTVIGHLSAARDAPHRHTRGIIDDKPLVGAAAERENVRMLQHQEHIRTFASSARRQQVGLQSERGVVVDDAQIDDGECSARVHRHKSIASPSAAKAACMIASDIVGCGCAVLPISVTVVSSALPSTTSEMMSVAACPIIWHPITAPYGLVATIFTKPAVSPIATALPIARNGILPIFTSIPRALASASLSPTLATSGSQ